MGNITRQGQSIVPSNWITSHGRDATFILPLSSRLISESWWVAAGIASFLTQPRPPSLSRPPHLAPGAAAIRPHGRHRRFWSPVDGDDAFAEF